MFPYGKMMLAYQRISPLIQVPIYTNRWKEALREASSEKTQNSTCCQPKVEPRQLNHQASHAKLLKTIV